MIVAVLAGAGPVRANVDDDFAFASGLVNFEPSFPILAQKVVDAILMKDPTQQDRSKIIRAEILIKRRQFAEAEALVAEMGMSNPASQAISLALGRNYYSIGEFEKARALYDSFFKMYEGRKPTDKDVVLRYRDAAYQYAQMQETSEDYEGAAASYQRVQEVTDSNELRRSMMLARAQALVRAAEKKSGDEKNKLLEEAAKICEEIQWGGLDLQFVDSIVIMANIELARGQPEAARDVLMSHMDIIRPIDDTMRELGMSLRESPMAGARSLLGRLLREEADRLAGQKKTDEAIAAYSKALIEYYNVFVKYGESTWGPTAGLMAKEIKDILENDYGKVVKIDLPDTKEAVGAEFRMADTLFLQKKYDEAAAEYLRVLAMFPESGDLSIGAIGNLMQCYMHLGNKLYTRMVAHYLGERFAGGQSDLPARALVSVAQLYNKAGDREMAKNLFDLYLDYCPDDPRAGQILFYLAVTAEQDGRKEEANAYLARIITDYQQDQNYPKALSKLAWKAYLEKDYAGSIGGMKIFIEESKGQPSPNLAQAMFALADSYRQTGDLPNAIRQFNALVNALAPADNSYARTTEDRQTVMKLLEQARFYLAFSLSRLPSDAARRAAIGKLDEFIELHPNSEHAAKVLNLKGSLQMALKDPAANETFERLAREYPDTDEGRNAQYARINGALELDQYDQAREAMAAMMASAGSYSVDEFARVGQAMLEHELWKEAAHAFGQVVGKTDQRALLERALYGIGAARYETGDYSGAVESLNDLMTRWPKSGLFYPAKFKLASANLKLNDLSGAKIAINDILKHAREAEVVNDATLLYAEVLKSENDLVGALSAYKRLEYFSSQNMKTERERRQIEEAILGGLAVAESMGRHAEVLESADRFLEVFPTNPKVNEIRQKRTTATLQLAAEVAAPAGTSSPDVATGEEQP